MSELLVKVVKVDRRGEPVEGTGERSGGMSDVWLYESGNRWCCADVSAVFGGPKPALRRALESERIEPAEYYGGDLFRGENEDRWVTIRKMPVLSGAGE